MSNTPKNLKDLYSGLLSDTPKNTIEVEKREPREIKLVFEMIQEAIDSAEDEKAEFRSVKSVFQDFGKLPAINAKLDSFANFNKQIKAAETGIVSLFSITVNTEEKRINLFIPESNLALSSFDSLIGKKLFLNLKRHKFGLVINSIGFDSQSTIEPAQIGLHPNNKPYIVNVNFPVLIATATYTNESISPGAFDFIELVNTRIIETIPSAKSVSDFFYKSLEKEAGPCLITRLVKSKDFETYRRNNKKLNINA
jgi:hypothetical protein